nr:2-hydroxyacyl-CoA dehydratase [Desulfobacterales bacterium]
MSYKEVEDHYLEYVVAQIKECLEFIGTVLGKKLDEDRLREVVRLSDKPAELFDEVQELRKAAPCPAGSEDILSCIMPMVSGQGVRLLSIFIQS